MSPVPNDDLIDSAPAASEAPEAPPVVTAAEQPDAPKPRRYIPCTGAQIGKFIRAVEMGLKGAHDKLESEIDEFLKGKGA